MIAVIIIVAVVTGAIAVITAATRTRPPGRHQADPPGEEDTFVAELRGQPADRFTPGVVVPFTPQLGEPLKPLPEPLADEPEPYESDDDFIESVAHLLPPAALARNIDEEVEEWRKILHEEKPPRPAHAADGQTTGEIFEHLCEGPGCWCQPWTPTPDAPPAEIVEGLNGHYTVDAAVESMFTRAQAEQVRALANGQVDHA